MSTIKQRILIGIARHGGRVNNPKQLVPHAQTDVHNVVHVLWRLQKQGLITFSQNKQRSLTVPTKIALTPKGQQHVRRALHGR